MIRAIARPSVRRQKSALRALLQDGGASRGPVGHYGHEVQAHRLLRPDVAEEHLVMTVRAHARRDLAMILRTAWPKPEITTTRSLKPKLTAPRFTSCR